MAQIILPNCPALCKEIFPLSESLWLVSASEDFSTVQSRQNTDGNSGRRLPESPFYSPLERILLSLRKSSHFFSSSSSLVFFPQDHLEKGLQNQQWDTSKWNPPTTEIIQNYLYHILHQESRVQGHMKEQHELWPHNGMVQDFTFTHMARGSGSRQWYSPAYRRRG